MAKRQMKEQLQKRQTNILTKGENAKFLNHELHFFISNLQKKAVESELDENCLIPKTDEKDKKIFEYLN